MLIEVQLDPNEMNKQITTNGITSDTINNTSTKNSKLSSFTLLSSSTSSTSTSSMSSSTLPNLLSLKHDENKISEENSKFNVSNKPTVRNILATPHKIPIYYLSRGNNSQLIDTVMTELGWKRTFDRHADYTLRWTENSIQINYGIFKEGEQLVNHIPNCGLLTNKLGLLISLRDYERRYQNRFGRLPIMVMDDFFPKTFIVDDLKEREAYFKLQENDEAPHMWICKPIGQNQGKGIFLVRDIEEFKVHLKNRDEEARHQPSGLLPRIIQRYIINPLLLDGCKFDIRCYVLIACTMPYLVFYHPGYIRRSAKPYSNQDQNLITHLTNQFVQKKDPAYAEVKNNTVWSWSQVNDYINKHYREEKKLPVDWTKTVLQWRIQRIIHHVFTTVKNRLAAKIGFFELLGLDFMLDENMKVWLLEVNSNPALQTHCDVLKEVVPVVVKDALHISIECFEKSRHQKCLLPLHGLDNLSAFVFCQRSNRYMRTSLDEMPIVNKISGDLGVPTGWNLLYNESQAAFRARWPILQSCSLRCWIPPRYKPPIIHNNPNLQRPVNDNNTEQNKSNSVSLQTCGSTTATNENVNMSGHTTDVVNCTSKEQNISKNTISNQLFHPRLSLPEYRTFESSLRRYPVTSNTMNNKILPRRNTLARQSLQNSKQTIHLQDIIDKIPQPESFITVKQPKYQNKTINANTSNSNNTSTNNNNNNNSNSRRIITDDGNQSTKQLISNLYDCPKSKHDLEVLSEDEILTGKRKTKPKLNLISISREPVQISRVHLITNSDIVKVFNHTTTNNFRKSNHNNKNIIPPTTPKHLNIKSKNQSTRIGGTSADHIYNNIDNIQNKSKLIGRPYASSNKLHFIESNDLITVTYETKNFINKSQNIHYSLEDRGS
ncbi:unnamed protein product [Schistosoma rodhaini]|uniref:Tubulin--tyrosine ligase-like protein 9 n=1 Tax=Schistosoma rodhaini TaxID=6188 RepID=A0AA85F0D2_9TREM|nr:unnamed protein product [Schistosoma rodhaini]